MGHLGVKMGLRDLQRAVFGLIAMFYGALYAEKVQIITSYPLSAIPVEFSLLQKAGFTVENIYSWDCHAKASFDHEDVRKIIFFDWSLDAERLKQIPKEKLIYLKAEPGKWDESYYDSFSQVFTWDDDLVDGVKFFKMYVPFLAPMKTELVAFENRKLCVMVSGSDGFSDANNSLYGERIRMVDFFETKPEGEFDIYGWGWGLNKPYYRDYRGSIPGSHSGPEKINTLSKYRFCVCFENTKDTHGYISEKILNCFVAGCVPIYRGPENIEEFIPKTCFIDYRDFENKEELYQLIKTMPKEIHEEYLNNMRLFIESSKGKCFLPEAFDQMMYEAVMR